MWRHPIYAIVRTGGKQYRVEANQTLDVERLKADVGDKVEFDVLMLAGNGDVRVGAPAVEGARVVAEVVEHGRGEKIIVFKYKNKTRYRRRQGHRQDYTRLAIKEIVADGKTVAKSEAKVSRPRSMAEPEPEADEATAVTAEAATETAAEAPAAKPARAKKPRKAATAQATEDRLTRLTDSSDEPATEAQVEGEPEAQAAAEAAEDIEAPKMLPEDAEEEKD
jgi:large subunit ribosomal protein L21